MLTAGVAVLSRLAAPKAARRRRSSPATRLGEYTALVAAGALALRRRAAAGALSRAGDAGGGAGRARRDGGDPRPRRRARCVDGCAEARASGEVVEAVNFNDPTQTVIAGSKAARRAGLRAAARRRAPSARCCCRCRRRSIRALMKPAAERLQRATRATSRSRRRSIPVSTTSMSQVETDPARDPRRARAPGVRPGALGRDGAGDRARAASTHIVECGPGKVLAGMAKRIDAELRRRARLDPASLGRSDGAARR